MYEKGSSIKVNVEIGGAGLKELEFVGKVVIDATDFMAVQFDTVIIPKMEIKSAEPIPDKPLEEVLGSEQETVGGVDRPKPPEVVDVRFLVEKTPPKKKPAPKQASPQKPPAGKKKPAK